MAAASAFSPGPAATCPGSSLPQPGALLGVPVDPFLHRVDVNERQPARARQQRRPPGQLRQEPPGPPSPAARRSRSCNSTGASRAWTVPGPAEQRAHRAVPQQVHVIDRIRPARHPGHQAPDLQVRVDPALDAGPDLLRDQIAEPGALRQRYHRDQPGVRHEIRVVERCVRPGQAMQQSHLPGDPASKSSCERLCGAVRAHRPD
jgi:hypothetical protein